MQKDVPYNEKELLEKCAAGDTKAFRILFDYYWNNMYANALHFMKSEQAAQDITQEVFIKIWVNRTKLKEVRDFAPYLYRVSKNLILDEFKKRVLPIIDQPFYDLFLISDLPTPQNLLEFKEVEKQIHTAIEVLPTQLRQAFKLSRFDGLTHDQISKKMNITKITSQNYIARSLQLIRKHLLRESKR